MKKYKRQWGATGVGGHVKETRPYVFEVSADASITARLSPGVREQIELILNKRSIVVPDTEGFFGTLANAIGLFDWGKRLREKSRPAAVRDNLRCAEAAASHLNDALNRLDGNSRQLLGETVPGGIRSLFGHMREIILPLKGAVLLAKEYSPKGGALREPPKGGDLPEPHRYFLAADVKDAIETHLDIRATCTKKGLFVEVLEVVLEEATGKPVKTVHELARAVIKHKLKRKDPDGIIEYVPPPNPI